MSIIGTDLDKLVEMLKPWISREIERQCRKFIVEQTLESIKDPTWMKMIAREVRVQLPDYERLRIVKEIAEDVAKCQISK